MSTASSLDAARVESLSASFGGRLLQPGDAGYDDARRVHNGSIDKRPALIARCRDAADVADAVQLRARDCSLEIAVRGGGHNVAGRARPTVGDVDLSPMRRVYVDPGPATARAQGGVVDRA